MGIEILLTALAGTITAFLGALKPLIEKVFYPRAEKYYLENPDSKWSSFLKLFFVFDRNIGKSFKDRLADSLSTLKTATGEVDNVIAEISKISTEKHQTIEKLEKQLASLETREVELKDKIETMKKVPVESLKHFEEILNKGNKKSARRDYLIFISGIIITTIIAIILNLL